MTRILTQAEVERLLPMNACIDVVEEALQTLARGDAVQPLRAVVGVPQRAAVIGTMPGYLGEPAALGLKVVGIFPNNHGGRYDSHQGIVMLFDVETGVPSVILDASAVTAIRTAAASAVATRALAREDVETLAILGSGVQAASHLDAMLAVRPFERVRVFSATPENRDRFAREASARTGMRVEARTSAEDAVRGADVVCVVTNARDPIVRGEWLSPGVHVNAVGACVRETRELDTDAVRRSRLFVDRVESAMNEAGDVLIPIEEGAITADHIVGELGQLLLGEVRGRESDAQITLFKSLGIAVYDLAVAAYVSRAAEDLGVGVQVELGGLRSI